VEFPVDIINGEDTIFNLKALSKAGRVRVIEDCLYNYEFHPNSLSQKKFTPNLTQSMQRHFEQRLALHRARGDLDSPAVRGDIAVYYIDHILPRLLTNLRRDPGVSYAKGIRDMRALPMYEFCAKFYPRDFSNLRKLIRGNLFKYRMCSILGWMGH